MLQKLLKYFGIFLLVIIAICGILYGVYNEKLPQGKTGSEADALAKKMLSTLNYDKYKSKNYIEWSFQGGANNYVWEKNKSIVTVSWNTIEVQLDLISTDSSMAYDNGIRITGNEKDAVVEKALSYFHNDSFWLVAPYKVFDEGVTRSIVPLENGLSGLLVTYSKGGTTPGDSYLWVLQPNGFPKSFKMWTTVLPIGGVKATWDDWAIMESGAYLPKSHVMGPLELSLGVVKGYNK